MKRTLAAMAALLVCRYASAEDLGTRVESLQAGMGISDFTGAAASALTKLGMEWELRLGLHLNLPIGIEIGYVRSRVALTSSPTASKASCATISICARG